jgi:hypothetical protein
MRIFAVLAVIGLGIVGCGYDPHPKDGKLPCTEGCPSGYECRCDKRCWQKQSDGGACLGDARDAQGSDRRSASPEVAIDGSADRGTDAPLPAVVDASLDRGYEVSTDIARDGDGPGHDGKTDAPPAADSGPDVPITADVAADVGTDADAPLPISTICIADQSRFDECSFGP